MSSWAILAALACAACGRIGFEVGGDGTVVSADWRFRKKLTFDSTKVGGGGVTNFPVVVSLTDLDLKDNAQPSGNDILFVSADGGRLSHEIEFYSDSTGELVAWVNASSISSTVDTTIYMYFGNSMAAAQQRAADVWDAGYVGVWHLQEDPSGVAPQSKDSTALANHGTASGMSSSDQVSGQMAGSLNFDGASTVTVGNSDALNMMGPITVEAWISLNIGQGSMVSFASVVDKSKNTSVAGYQLSFNGTNTNMRLTTVNAVADRVEAAITFVPGTWHHVAGTWSPSPGSRVLYVDGTERALMASTNTMLGLDPATLGLGGSVGSTGCCWNGKIDEVRISTVARSAAWIATEYNNESSPSTFTSVGALESND